VGHSALVEGRATRLQAVHQHAGSLPGVYEADHLERLRRDWPQ